MNELKERIMNDLARIGIDIRSPIILRPYSKTLWGYYDVDKDKIIVYAYSNKMKTRFVHYDIVFRTVLHEYVHRLQRNCAGWKRYKGVMHDKDFWRLYNTLVNLAVKGGIIYGKIS